MSLPQPVEGVNYTLIGLKIHLLVAATCLISLVIFMITSGQIRAARALLGWSQQQLADRAIVSVNAIARLEREQVDSRASTLAAVEKALLRAGVEFISPGDRGEGVRFAKAER
jgi:DNA-binding XRE family transcriptional regulator